ncbi:DUF6453 family protein [Morganella morganii]
MSRYGIYVQPETGSKPFYLDDSGCQMLSKIGSFPFRYNSTYDFTEPPGMWNYDKGIKSWVTNVNGLDSYNAFVIVKKGSHAAFQGRLTGVVSNWTKRIWLDGNTLCVDASTGDASAWNDDPYGGFFQYEVFGTPKRTASDSNYGIQLSGMNNVTTITDLSKLGYCVWAGDIYSPGWDGVYIPGYDIGNESRYTLYVRPKNGEAVMMKYKNIIKTKNATTLQIILFDHMPDFYNKPKFGIEIRNKNGVVTYTSKYAPLMGGQVLTNKSGSTWYSRPFFNLGNYGTYVSSIKNKYYDLAAMGLYVSGNYYDVRHMTNVSMGWMGDMWTDHGEINGVFNTHCIDGDLYL